MYASRNSHYSCKRAWDILGGGESGVREFDVDSLDELRSRIQDDRESGRLPVAIMGTLGTTNTGEIEPLDRLSEIAAEERLWLHIDGAYGGGVLMLEEFAWLHEAVNRADSFSFDPHKWLGMPMGTGTVFLNAKHSFQKSFSFSAVFTDHQTFTSVIPDQCQMSIQGTRQLPGLRVWGAIRLLGFAEIKRRIRRTIALAQFLVKLLERHPNFQVLAHGQLSVVVFTVKGFDYEALLRLLKELAVNDEAFLTLTQVKDVWGIRATIISADTTEADLEFIVERIVNRVSAEAIEKFYSPRLHRPEMHRDIFGADEYIGQLDFWTTSEIEELGAKLKLSARSHLLDIGSGYGGPACFLASVFGCRVSGVDASSTNYEVALATAAARKLTGQVSFIHADVLELSFADDTFDAVIALDSVVHIKDKQVLFELCQKWLRPNGTMLMAVEAVDAGIPDQLKAMRESAGAVFCETADRYREIFLQAGLTVSEEKQYPGKRLEFSSQALRWMDANGQSAGRESMELINRLGKLGLAEEVVFLVQKPPAKPKPHEENT
jgi:cyclopropane fatty-acyl-phospholipid synthase-like methyltransferase